jgi:regulator of sirC expression with transglutaminase-like and TPR domain
MTKNELSALISLLDDPDEKIFQEIREKIKSIGSEVIPLLENAWETSFDSLLQNRVENLIHTIQFESINQDLSIWAQAGGHDLLSGVLLIARYQYPDLNEKKVRAHIDQMRNDVWLELNANLTALEKVRVINHIVFDVHGFSGNTQNFHAPQNSYINNVLESKKGNPLSLSILYTIIAQGLNIPIFGVNLPEHFILAYVEESTHLPILAGNPSPKVIFYINPFSKGSAFSYKEIDSFLKQLKLDPDKMYYEPCSNIDMISRLIRNLIFSFEKLGYPDKSKEMQLLLSCVSR